MHIDRIDNLAQFERIKASWDAAYGADPNAHVFISWDWLRAWFEICPRDWFVLAAKDERTDAYVGFLPLAMRSIRVSKIDIEERIPQTALVLDHLVNTVPGARRLEGLERHLAGDTGGD